MRLTNEICISFLQGSGWLLNHDKEITISERNKAIDDYTCYVIHEEAIGNIKSLDDYDRIAERLKRGAEND